ncbi:MAG: ABC transporter ATP-binding protein [Planctomycetota bacterium]
MSAESQPDEPLLRVQDLRVSFKTDDGWVRAVRGVSFDLWSGETLAIVGESGSGKSVTNLAMMGLVPTPPGKIESGTAMLGGRDLLQLSTEEMQKVRGRKVSMIFQDPMTALNPLMTIGQQMMEITRLHLSTTRKAARNRAVEMLDLVGIPSPESRLNAYPHEFSGGMRQRVMIAMALSCEPELLIADEPTTALDVTIQAQIMDLLGELKTRCGTSIILITHDLGVVAGVADRVVVMFDGEVLETADVDRLFANPTHEYTKGLLAAVPRLDAESPSRLQPIQSTDWKRSEDEASSESAENEPTSAAAGASPVAPTWSRSDAVGNTADPLLSVQDLQVRYPLGGEGSLFKKQWFQAVDGISFDIKRGETLGLVGESGCGKSTTTRAILNLTRAAGGNVMVEGQDILGLPDQAMMPYRRRLQMVFQDPYASLNPRMTAGNIIGEPLTVHGLASGRDRKFEVLRLMQLVGLEPKFLNRYPHEFSGGQRQRIGIARALAVQPELILCDEPVSALDVSIQAQIINLMMDLQDQLGIAYLFISHDLAVVRHIADRVGVMYAGKIVELAAASELYRSPQHPYTQALLSAVPIPDPVVARQRQRIRLPAE